MAKKRISLDEVSTGADLKLNTATTSKRSLVTETICTRTTAEVKAALEQMALDEDISLSKYLERMIKKHVQTS